MSTPTPSMLPFLMPRLPSDPALPEKLCSRAFAASAMADEEEVTLTMEFPARDVDASAFEAGSLLPAPPLTWLNPPTTTRPASIPFPPKPSALPSISACISLLISPELLSSPLSSSASLMSSSVVISNQEGMGMPMLRDTGCTGALGRMKRT